MDEQQISSGAEKVERIQEEKQLHERERKALAEKRKEARMEREEKKGNGNRGKGNGGWMAAVIALGFTTLTLASVVTAGAVERGNYVKSENASYRSTFYELVGLMDEMETDLEKLSVSSSLSEQRTLATNLLVASSLAEGTLERFPVSVSSSVGMAGVLNGTRDFSDQLLASFEKGEKMDERAYREAEHLLKRQSKLKAEMNTLAEKVSDDDFQCLIKGEGKFMEIFGSLTEKPKEMLEETASLSSSSAGEETLRKIFRGYSIRKIECTGETKTKRLKAYNYTLTDEKDRTIFAQLSERGELLFFDTFEECSAKNYTVEKCEAVAREFLKELKMEGMQSVFVSENGTSVDFTFVPQIGEVLYYPQEIKVKVCETKGKVIGLNAVGYYAHRRKAPKLDARITPQQAMDEVSLRLKVEKVGKAIIPVRGKEVLTYEVYGTKGEKYYLVYVDATTGEEVAIFSIVNTKQGMILK